MDFRQYDDELFNDQPKLDDASDYDVFGEQLGNTGEGDLDLTASDAQDQAFLESLRQNLANNQPEEPSGYNEALGETDDSPDTGTDNQEDVGL